MSKFPLPKDEAGRLASLLSYDLMDSGHERGFDDIVQLASLIFDKPIVLISLVGEDRQWFKAHVGIDVCETPREVAFCNYTIMSPEVMVVPDAREDERFADNEVVTGEPYIRFYAGAPLVDQSGHALGTLCLIDTKPGNMSPEQIEMLRLLAGQVSDQIRLREYERYAREQIQQSAIHNGLLQKQVQDQSKDMARSHEQLIRCLARAAECRDDDTGHHIRRVSMYVRLIAREMGLDARQCNEMAMASMLHDIGKIGVPDELLLKPGKLTPDEFEQMKQHTQLGANIINSMLSEGSIWMLPHSAAVQQAQSFVLDPAKQGLMQTAATIALTHHEKFDGSGYPQALSGMDIPLAGRIVAVADVFDALSSDRPYKQAYPLPECMRILEEGRGRHFDPDVLDAFNACLQEVVVIREQWVDPPCPASAPAEKTTEQPKAKQGKEQAA